MSSTELITADFCKPYRADCYKPEVKTVQPDTVRSPSCSKSSILHPG